MSLAFVVLALATAQGSSPASLHIRSALAAYEAGNSAAQQAKYREAVEQYKQAIQIEPTFRDAFEKMIAVCRSAGQRSEAASAATQLLEIEPDLMQYRLLLGQILSEQGEMERALAQFSMVLRSDRLNPDALLGFAQAARRLGMEDRAADALRKGRENYPLDPRFR